MKKKYAHNLKINKYEIDKQIVSDYYDLFSENQYMTRRNALRQLNSTWNMPIDMLREIIDFDIIKNKTL
jgi:hypothetical protein